MIRRHLDVRDVLSANKQTKYVNCGLLVNFSEFFANDILFMTKEHEFKIKLVTLASDFFPTSGFFFFAISKLILLFSYSFHVPCIIISNAYFYIVSSMFPFRFN